MTIAKIRHALIAMLTTGLVACGGGGGGDSANTGLTYTGNTARATISSDSARDSASQALGGMAGASLTRSSTDTKETVTNIIKRLLSQKGTRAILETGTCGGNISDTVHTETQTDYVATWHFNSFCEAYGSQTITISGSVDVSMTADSTGVTSMSMKYNDITVTEQPGNYSMTMAGTISFNFVGSSDSFTMTLVMSDSTGESVMFENYQVSVSGTLYSISGRFYHSTHGYVDFSTPTSLNMGYGGYPSSGQLLIQGANGRALITATSSTTYTLQLDIDGQPSSSQSYSW